MGQHLCQGCRTTFIVPLGKKRDLGQFLNRCASDLPIRTEECSRTSGEQTNRNQRDVHYSYFPYSPSRQFGNLNTSWRIAHGALSGQALLSGHP